MPIPPASYDGPELYYLGRLDYPHSYVFASPLDGGMEMDEFDAFMIEWLNAGSPMPEPLSEVNLTATLSQPSAIDNGERISQTGNSEEFEAQEDAMTLIVESSAQEETLGEFQTRDHCRCEACKIVRPIMGDPTKLKPSVIHSYSYKPRNWTPKSIKDDPFTYFLGVELETDAYSTSGGRDRFGRLPFREDSVVRDRVAADMRLPKRLWIPKHDSSVTGPEFVSQPATLSYWNKSKPQLREMFKMLLHAGYRSHDNDNAGMHINISKSAFDDADHLYRFLTLIHFSPVWARRMAQRTEVSANSWAEVGMNQKTRRQLSQWAMMPNGTRPYIESNEWIEPEFTEDAFGIRRRVRGTGEYRSTLNPNYIDPPYVPRYTALNIPEGESRFEFRLPRGTLRVDRFFKNLQWTVAMVEYTRTADVLLSRPKAFMDWTMLHRRQYPELAGFLMERAPRLQAASKA